MKVIGIFGGTFDPVHNGHLQMAVEAKQSLSLDEVRLIPCHQPPHRDMPTLTSLQRLHLLSLAIREYEGLVVDDRELQQDQTSYTIKTLHLLREEFGDQASLVLMMGADAFSGLDTWYQWQSLRELAHIVVMSRPDSPLPTNETLLSWMQEPDERNIVHDQPAGGFVLLQQSLLPISSTQVRAELKKGRGSQQIPESVARYIKEQRLYTGK